MLFVCLDDILPFLSRSWFTSVGGSGIPTKSAAGLSNGSVDISGKRCQLLARLLSSLPLSFHLCFDVFSDRDYLSVTSHTSRGLLCKFLLLESQAVAGKPVGRAAAAAWVMCACCGKGSGPRRPAAMPRQLHGPAFQLRATGEKERMHSNPHATYLPNAAIVSPYHVPNPKASRQQTPILDVSEATHQLGAVISSRSCKRVCKPESVPLGC